MDREDFRKKLAAALELPLEVLTDQHVPDGGHFDSLGVLGIIALVDEQFGVSVPAKELESCASVGQLLDTIARALAASPTER